MVSMSNKNSVKGFGFFLMDGNLCNCATNSEGLIAHVKETRVPHDGAHTEQRNVVLVHRATRGDWEAAEALESRLIARCEAGPAKGYTVLSTEYWDVESSGPWYKQ